MVLATHPLVGFSIEDKSTLEYAIEGKTMICWPQYMDQRVTSRLVDEFSKLRLDMKEICDRFVVANVVKDLMYKKLVEKLSELVIISVQEGSLSYHNLDFLINDIKGLVRILENGNIRT